MARWLRIIALLEHRLTELQRRSLARRQRAGADLPSDRELIMYAAVAIGFPLAFVGLILLGIRLGLEVPNGLTPLLMSLAALANGLNLVFQLLIRWDDLDRPNPYRHTPYLPLVLWGLPSLFFLTAALIDAIPAQLWGWVALHGVLFVIVSLVVAGKLRLDHERRERTTRPSETAR